MIDWRTVIIALRQQGLAHIPHDETASRVCISLSVALEDGVARAEQFHDIAARSAAAAMMQPPPSYIRPHD
jgi:hypothetical protein